MKKIYFTITGTQFYHGSDFLKPGMKVRLGKEPDNRYDKEAIKVSAKGLGLGQIGYVANSIKTVIGESWSAGRMYDHFDKKATGTVKVVLPTGVDCYIIIWKGKIDFG